MPEKQEPQRKKIGAWIAPELYEQVEALGYKTWTEAIIRGLELIISEKQLGQNRAQIVAPGAHLGDSGVMGQLGETQGINGGELGQLRASMGHLQEIVDEKEKHIETLKTELEKAAKNKEDLKEQLKSNDENQLLRITDLKEEISVLRNELTNKNDTIKNLTTITESQIKGYKLIEAPGAKKPWWRFW